MLPEDTGSVPLVPFEPEAVVVEDSRTELDPQAVSALTQARNDITLKTFIMFPSLTLTLDKAQAVPITMSARVYGSN
jgi:hypothetical protein